MIVIHRDSGASDEKILRMRTETRETIQNTGYRGQFS